jgi:cytochrome b6-f complex iron-sulfur subunit
LSRDIRASKHPSEPISRRDVLVAMGGLGLFGAAISVVRGTLRFLTPPVTYVPPPTILAGPPADFPLGRLTHVPSASVLIGRDDGGLFALSVVCTHLGCTVATTDGRLACPCHGSQFSLDGATTTGPAASPLPHLALRLTADGLVEVDLHRIVAADTRLAM